MIKFGTNISWLSSLAAIGLSAFAGAAALSASSADAAEYILNVPVSGSSLVPGTVDRVDVSCYLSIEPNNNDVLVPFGSGQFQIPATSTEFSTTITITRTSDIGGLTYSGFACTLSGSGRDLPNTIRYTGPFSVDGREPLKAHPGSVIVIRGNLEN